MNDLIRYFQVAEIKLDFLILIDVEFYPEVEMRKFTLMHNRNKI